MRRVALVALVVLAGCGRSFTAPQTQNAPPSPPPQLKVSPSTLTPAPDEVDTLTVTSGVPPFTYSSELHLDGGCGLLAPDDGGAISSYAACLNPNQRDVVHVTDGDGGTFDVTVTVGAPFSASQQGTSGNECSEVHVTVGGGAAPYQILPPAGASFGTCDAGAPFQIVDRTLTQITFLLPPYDPTGTNTYTYTALDAVEFNAATPNPANVVQLTVSVNTPASQLPPLVASPVSGVVRPGDLVSLSASGGRGAGTFHFELAWNGNSSHGSVNGLTYTAGPNANTVDHLLLVDDDPNAGVPSSDLYVTVANPQLSAPVLVPQTLRVGDVDGDGFQDLMLQGLDVGGSATLGFVYGGAVPTTGRNLIIPGGNNQVKDVTLADVTGDGMADVLVRYQQAHQLGGGGKNLTPDCNPHPQSACWPDAGPGSQLFGCGLDSNNNPQCYAPEYTPSGSETSVLCTVDAQGLHCSDDGAQLDCVPADAGYQTYGPQFQCSKYCVTTNSGNLLCNAAVNCGPNGNCVLSETHSQCYQPFGDGGYTCGAFINEPDGGSTPLPCRSTGPGAFDCGLFQCHDDGFGGYDCGPADCLPGPGPNEFACFSNSCGVPDGGPHAACANDGQGDFSCRVCGVPVPATPATSSAVELYESLPGGGRLSRGLMPYCGDGFPGLLAPGQLLVVGGFQVNVDEVLGQIGFDLQNDGGQVKPLPAQQADRSPERVFVATDVNGQPWGAAELMSVRQDGGTQNLAELDGIASPGTLFSTPVNPDANDKAMNLVGLATLDDVGGQSFYAINLPAGGGSQLVTFDPPGSACGGSVTDLQNVGLPGGGQEQTLAPDESVIDAVPLPSIRAIALGVSRTKSFAGERWLLLHRNGSCQLEFDPWVAHHLPALESPGQAADGGSAEVQPTALAAMDFNGDGLDDLCIATTAGLEFYPGAAKRQFSEGEQYEVSGIVASLSVIAVDGGTLVAAEDILARSIDLFATADNTPPSQGGPPGVRSSLAYMSLEQTMDPSPTGIALRNGGELWTLAVEGSSWVALRYPDATQIDASPTPVPLLTDAGTLTMIDQVQSLWADPARDDAAWALLADLQSGDVHALHLTAEGSSLSVDPATSVVASGALQNLAAYGVDKSGFRYAVYTGGALVVTEPSGSPFVSADGGPFLFGGTELTDGGGGFWPSCGQDNKGTFVQDAPIVLIEGSAGCPGQNGGNIRGFPSNPCCGSSQGLFAFDETTGVGLAAPVAGLNNNGGVVRRAFEVDLPDGGAEIVAAGFGFPGFFVLHQAADGTWQNDSAAQLDANFSDIVEYPDDGGRYIGIQLEPASVRVLTP
ncbi:MAG: VCBS repeat-containing protein [Deltaproteobacteria bacterium]|nr:VCBS repeat-containing protein [Deltaproteobacteria bacterium]